MTNLHAEYSALVSALLETRKFTWNTSNEDSKFNPRLIPGQVPISSSE